MMFESFTKTASVVPSLGCEPELLGLTHLADDESGVCMLFPSRSEEEDPLQEMLNNDAHYGDLVDECKSKMEEAFQNAEECKMVFAPMKDLALENAGTKF